MAHRRDEIRKIIVNQLKNKTLAKENVFNWRLKPIQSEPMPCITVIIPKEEIISLSGCGNLLKRKADIEIMIYNSISSHEDNMCDEISREVETLMYSIKEKDFQFELNSMEIFTESHSTRFMIMCLLKYECTYNSIEIVTQKYDEFSNLSIEVF